MLNTIRLSATWQSLFFLSAAVLGTAVLAWLSARYGWARRLAKPALALYALAVAFVTLLSREPSPVRFVRLNLFRSYRSAFRSVVRYNRNRKTILPRVNWTMREMILNVVLFLPVGALLACLFPRMRPVKAALAGLLSSLAIEVAQAVFRLGVFDVCDLVHNTLGTVLGFYLYRRLESAAKRKALRPCA